MNKDNLIGKTYGSYCLQKRLGAGAFGEIYLGKGNTGDEMAIKLEPANTKYPQLIYEGKLYTYLAKKHDGDIRKHGIPKVKWFGYEDGFNVMVMDILGKSLEDLFKYCGRKFTLKTVLMLAK